MCGELLSDCQVRWHYEHVVIHLLEMSEHFGELSQHAPDPELRKACGEAFETIFNVINGLRRRFKLAWVDSKEFRAEDWEVEGEKLQGGSS